MVGAEKSKQVEGFDLNDYVLIDTSANPYGADAIGFIVAGQGVNAPVALPPNMAALMLANPPPPAGFGPQYPWPYEGIPGQLHTVPANMPINPAHVQRTTFRVSNLNNILVWYLDRRLAEYLSAFLRQFPAAALAGPTAGFWPLPVAEPLYGAVGNYTFERKWVWLFYQRAVPGVDVDLEVYMRG
jgi:hypothetical protein